MSHKTHCCDRHGCKYGDPDCPVATGEVKQEGPCETCGLYWEGFYSSEDAYKETGPAQVTLRDNTKELIHRLMKKTGSYDPEIIINGAATFLLEGLEELEKYKNADET